MSLKIFLLAVVAGCTLAFFCHRSSIDPMDEALRQAIISLWS